VTAVALLLTALVALDPRVRGHVRDLLRKDALSADVSTMRRQMRDVSSVLMTTARDRSLDHAPVVVFVAVSSVLVVAMLRL
jgi:hypothetical protein